MLSQKYIESVLEVVRETLEHPDAVVISQEHRGFRPAADEPTTLGRTIIITTRMDVVAVVQKAMKKIEG